MIGGAPDTKEPVFAGDPGQRMAVWVDVPKADVARETGPSREREQESAGVLLLHGFTGHRGVWDEAVSTYLPDRLVIRPDALGHGASDLAPDAEDHRLAAQAETLLAALDRIDAPLLHAVGYSMGGRLLFALALLAPERFLSLTVEGASPGIADPSLRSARRAQDEVLARLLLNQGIETFVRHWEDLPLFATQKTLPPEVIARQRTIRLSQRPEGLAASLRGAGQGVEPSRWQDLPRLKMPILFVAGEADTQKIATGRSVASAVADGRLWVVPGSGHSPHMERPDLFWGRVLAFWKDVEARAQEGRERSSRPGT